MIVEHETYPEPQPGASPMGRTPARTVLILISDHRMATVLSAYLDQEGYQVLAPGSGPPAALALTQRRPDIVFTDQEALQSGEYESLFRPIPQPRPAIFTLSGKQDRNHRRSQHGLQEGEPVERPVRPRTLVRRVRAALHRAGKKAPEARTYQSAGMTLNRDRHTVQVAGHFFDLTPTEFDLLAVLIASPGQVFTRAELRDRVLGPDSRASDRTIDVHVMNIRAKLAAETGDHSFIETVHRAGYRFAPD